jgi:hypothetical protein
MARFASAIAVAAVLFAGSTAEGRSETAEGKERTTVGSGLLSCGSWTQARQIRGTKISLVEQWVFGFISSANTYAPRAYMKPAEVALLPDYLDGLDADALLSWIDNFCREHPLEDVGTAAMFLLVELERRKLK